MNEEQYEGLRDTLHDALEEVILDLDDRNKEDFKITNKKIDELNENIKELIKILCKLV